MKVSIVVCATGRETLVHNSLHSLEKLTYKNLEILFLDCVLPNHSNLHEVYSKFEKLLPIQYHYLERNLSNVYNPDQIWTPATTYNHGIELSTGEFVIILSADLIISNPDLVEQFLHQYNNRRESVITYFLDGNMTKLLEKIDWYNHSEEIQKLDGFWTRRFHGDENQKITSAGIHTYLTGQTKERWKWMGKFRTEFSHLVSDQDLVMREKFLGCEAETLDGCVAYHQDHPIDFIVSNSNLSPGWNYHTEAQARLLEPAPRDEY